MTNIPLSLRKVVVERAGDRCEYCRLSQVTQEASFHIDHVVPRSAAGQTSFDNLALACVSCSLRKWATTEALDPLSGLRAPLFNPRLQNWDDHFEWAGIFVRPRTAVGGATIAALDMNRKNMLIVRQFEIMNGHHPPT